MNAAPVSRQEFAPLSLEIEPIVRVGVVKPAITDHKYLSRRRKRDTPSRRSDLIYTHSLLKGK